MRPGQRGLWLGRPATNIALVEFPTPSPTPTPTPTPTSGSPIGLLLALTKAS